MVMVRLLLLHGQVQVGRGRDERLQLVPPALHRALQQQRLRFRRLLLLCLPADIPSSNFAIHPQTTLTQSRGMPPLI